jgi:hypothetical protein
MMYQSHLSNSRAKKITRTDRDFIFVRSSPSFPRTFSDLPLPCARHKADHPCDAM